MTPRFTFLDVKTYLTPGLSLDGWCKANGCETYKVVFPYEWLHDHDKLSHIGPIEYENFYSKLKGRSMVIQGEYTEFVQEFHSRGCLTIMDQLKVYNEADVIPFAKALDKTRNK